MSGNGRGGNGRGGTGRGGTGRGGTGSATGRPSARDRAQQAQQQAERRRQRRILALVAVGFVVVVLVVGIGVQAFRSHRSPSAASGVGGSEAGFASVTVTDGKPLTLGRPRASVTVELFEDFHCPHCAEFEEKFGPTVRNLQDQGTVTVALYPMAFIDSGSAAAANAMACAAESGFGQAYYYGLFANHTLQWSDSQLLDLADKVGRPGASFRDCVSGKAHQGWVDSINRTAAAKGVTATPTLFVDGRQLPVETLTVEQFSAAVDQAARTN